MTILKEMAEHSQTCADEIEPSGEPAPGPDAGEELQGGVQAAFLGGGLQGDEGLGACGGIGSRRGSRRGTGPVPRARVGVSWSRRLSCRWRWPMTGARVRAREGNCWRSRSGDAHVKADLEVRGAPTRPRTSRKSSGWVRGHFQHYRYAVRGREAASPSRWRRCGRASALVRTVVRGFITRAADHCERAKDCNSGRLAQAGARRVRTPSSSAAGLRSRRACRVICRPAL